VAGSHRVLVTRAVGLVELSAVLSLAADVGPSPTRRRNRRRTGRTYCSDDESAFDVAGQEWFANWDSGEATVDVTAGTRRPATPPPSYAPPKLSAVDGDQRRRRRRMLQAIAAVLVPLVAVDFQLQLIVTFPLGPSF